MDRRGRPTKARQQAEKAALEAQKKLFDVEPYTIKPTVKYVLPKEDIESCTTLDLWLKWMYQFLLLNKEVMSIIEVYETGIQCPYSLLETMSANDADINNLLEARIINLTLQGKIKSVFSAQLLVEKYGWNMEAGKNVSLNTDEIKFQFG